MLAVATLFGAGTAHAATFNYVDNAGTGSTAIGAGTSCAAPLVRTINVTDSYAIGDVKVGFVIQHAYRGDVQITVTSPGGTSVQVVTSSGADNNINWNIELDDASGNPLDNNLNHSTAATPYQYTVSPSNALSAFDGENVNGTWTFSYCDTFTGADDGNLLRAELIIEDTSGPPSGPAVSPAVGTVINSYAKVNSIAGSVLGVSTTTGFTAGSRALIIQMQGSTVTTTDNASHGDITAYNSAGRFEYVEIASAGGGTITLASPPTVPFNTGGSVQIVSVPVYNSTTIASQIVPQPWNGDTGGVVALDDVGTLTLSSGINATGHGFRGGALATSIAFDNCLSDQTNYTSAVTAGTGNKGEGIIANAAAHAARRGHRANGGGGGNITDAGGGGGGNVGAGGVGGRRLDLCDSTFTPVGGLGGQGLSYAPNNRVFMGGGGGSGSEVGQAPVGGARSGGGIIMVRANNIVSTGGFLVSQGLDAASDNSNGADGGAAAGSIVVSVVGSITGSPTADVSGGDGGDESNPSFAHGTGGGGGGGAIRLFGTTCAFVSPIVNGGSAGMSTLGAGIGDPTWGAAAGGPGDCAGNFSEIGLVTQTDYSDAPTSGTAPSGTGTNAYGDATHTITAGIQLGAAIDGEAASLASATANGDDTNATDDEDGVSTVPDLTEGDTSYTIPSGNFTATGTGTLHGWMDFDGNGTFDNDEHTSVAVTTGTLAGDLTWSFTDLMSAGTTFARFRFTSDAGVTSATPATSASDGEVEDYQATVQLLTTDTSNPELCVNRSGSLIGANQFTAADNGTFGTGPATPTSYANPNPYPGLVSGTGYLFLTTGGGGWIGQGRYAYISNMQENLFGVSHVPIIDPDNGSTGRVLIVNGSDQVATLFTQTLTGLTPNTNYEFSIWATNILDADLTGNVDPNLSMRIDGTTYYQSGDIVETSDLIWSRIGFVFNTGPNTTATLSIIDEAGSTGGNDFALDNATLRSCSLPAGDITGSVYADTNGNDTFDTGSEAKVAVAGISITLIDTRGDADPTNDITIVSTETDANGDYSFTNIPVGSDYSISIDGADPDIPAGATVGTTNPLTGVSVTDGGTTTNQNFGLDGIAIDFSDAPTSGTAPSGTGTNAYGDATHTITAGIQLGAAIDGETSSLASAAANGDDTNATDDEDGVSTVPDLTVGDTGYTIPSGNVTATGTGTLHAWVDFDGNGTFDSDEHTSVAVTTGTLASDLTWSFSDLMSAGTTFVRFRFTSDGGVTASTPALVAFDGEVEDHQVTVAAPLVLFCPLGYTLGTAVPNPSTADSVVAAQTTAVDDFTPALGSPATAGSPASNANGVRIRGTNGEDTLTLDMGQLLPENAVITLSMGRLSVNAAHNMTVRLSDDGVTYTDVLTAFTDTTEDTYEVVNVLVPAGGARYIQYQRNTGAWAINGLNYSDICIATGNDITGTIFDDAQYGGGAGRDYATADGAFANSEVGGASVELYDNAGNLSATTTTAADGTYSFTGLADGDYYVRVVNDTVQSQRPGSIASLIGVQTFRTDGTTDVTGEVGGRDPSVADTGANAGGTLNTTSFALDGGQAQSVQPVTVSGADVTGVDFGFNFDTIVNTNDAGQGSLRQFITNSNALTNGGLAQQGLTAGDETTIFMIPNPGTDPRVTGGTGPGQINFGADTSGGSGSTFIINISSVRYDDIVDANTVIDGATQTTFTGDTNGPVADLSTGPEVLLDYSGSTFGLSGAKIDFQAGGDNGRVRNIGITQTTSSGFGIKANNVANIVVDNVTVVGNASGGIQLADVTTNSAITNSIFVNNAVDATNGDGIDVKGTGILVEGNSVSGSQGFGVDLRSSPNTSTTVRNNRIFNNGYGGSQAAGIGARTGDNHLIENNEIFGNTEAGIIVTTTGPVTISQNSIYDNGTLGIDLNDDNVTINDANDADTGDNSLLNFPVFNPATISGGNLIITGCAPAGAIIELFEADVSPTSPTAPNASNAIGGVSQEYGEGESYLTTLTEGSGGDTDAATCSLPVDADGNNQTGMNAFSFTVAVPAGVASADLLTATATDASGNTSEFSPVVTVLGQADVSLTKIASSLAPVMGQPMTFTVTATNDGPEDALGLQVTDALPSGYAFVSATASLGTYTEGTGLWDIGTLPNGDSETLTITAVPMGTGVYQNIAEVTAMTNADPDSIPGTGATNGLTGDDYGDGLNNGVPDTTGQDDDEATVTPVPVLGTGTVTPQICPAGSVSTLDWDASTWVGGSLSNSYTVDGEDIDITFSGDTAAFTTGMPSLSNSHTGGLVPAEQGLLMRADFADNMQEIVATIDVGTPGTGVDELRFNIFDLDANASFTQIESIVVEGYLNGVPVTPELEGGATVSINGNQAVGVNNASQTSAVGNLQVGFASPVDQVVIRYTPGPGSPANPTLTAATVHDLSFCTPVADLSLAKVVDNASVSANQTVTFTLTVTNDGPAAATGVQVTDLLPAGLTYVSDNTASNGVGDDTGGAGDDSYDDTTGLWIIPGSIANGASVSLEIVAQVAAGMHTNEAAITASDLPDPDSDPATGAGVDDLGDSIADDDEASVTVTALNAVLAVSKTSDVYDPTTAGLFAIPGNDMLYTITVTNTGDGPADSDSVLVIDALPPEIEFYNGDIDDGGPETNPIAFSQTGGAGLTLTYGTDVAFSDQATAPTGFAGCTYTPSAGYDPNVTFICINPKGAMAAGDPDPTFTLQLRGRIK